jgi:hypothetical protein
LTVPPDEKSFPNLSVNADNFVNFYENQDEFSILPYNETQASTINLTKKIKKLLTALTIEKLLSTLNNRMKMFFNPRLIIPSPISSPFELNFH